MFGKVTARNYAMQAAKGLHEYIARATKPGGLDVISVKLLINMFQEAQRFAIPDLGRVLDDDLKGLEGQELYLPYPMVALEFFVPRIEERLTGETPTYSPKRVVILVDMSRDFILHARKSYEDKGVPSLHPIADPSRLSGDRFIFFACAAEIHGLWRPMAATWLFQVSNWDAGAVEVGPGKLANSVRGEMGCLLPDYAADLIKRYGPDEARRIMQIDIEGELRATLEFIEAVTCSNITTAVHEPGASESVNQRRVRQGKLPLVETKTLVIDPAWLEKHHRERAAASGDSDRASPRQHLRRGHFRRWDIGTRFQRQIWIPPTVVGDIERGRIDKDYRFK